MRARGALRGGGSKEGHKMKEVGTYEAPAFEIRENVAGLLGRQKGSYCPPKGSR